MRRRSAALLALALLLPLQGVAGEVVVKPGETLSEIAERYGTSVQRLMQLNNLRSPQDLWAGSRIQVPGGGGGRAASGGASRTTTVNANYTVKPGETLSELADRYGTTVQRLMQLNNLSSTQDLWAGSRIQVPVTRTTTASKPAAVNKSASQHKVQSGETLSVIADRYGVSMQSLIALNNLKDPDSLEAGSTLKLRNTSKPAAKPAPKTAVKTASKPVAKPAAKPQAQPATPAVAVKPEPKPAPKPQTTPVQTPVETAVQPVAKPAPQAATTVAAATVKPAVKPEPKPAAQPATQSQTTPTTTKPAAKPTTTAAAKPAKPSAPDWRSYGPLQVDWANWQPMGGSYVAPSLNSDGQPLYLAINCNAKRLNATGQSGTWKTWDAPQSDFEHKLINDLCTAKGG